MILITLLHIFQMFYVIVIVLSLLRNESQSSH